MAKIRDYNVQYTGLKWQRHVTTTAKAHFYNARDLSLENSANSFLCFRLALLHSVSYFFFHYQPPISSLSMFFDAISSNIDEGLSINPSVNVFVFGDSNVHHKDWLTYSGRTDRPGELCYNLSISSDLTQMINFPTRIPDCLPQSWSFGFIYFFWDEYLFCNGFRSILNFWSCCCLTFHWISVKLKGNTQFHHITYDCSRADWDGLRHHLRNVLWEDIFKLGASAASEFLWVGLGWNWCIYTSS